MSLTGQIASYPMYAKTQLCPLYPNSDANVIRIISAKWKIWIVRGAGSKKLAPRILEITFRKQ